MKTYTIQEFLDYIGGFATGEFGKEKTLSGADVLNAITSIEDPYDGIEACIIRNFKQQLAEVEARRKIKMKEGGEFYKKPLTDDQLSTMLPS